MLASDTLAQSHLDSQSLHATAEDTGRAKWGMDFVGTSSKPGAFQSPPSRHHDPTAPGTGELLICGPNATGVCPLVEHQPWPPPACTATAGSEETRPHCSLLCTHRILAFKERNFRDDSKEWHHQTVRAGLTRTHPPPHPQEPARTRENARSRRIHTQGWLNRIIVADQVQLRGSPEGAAEAGRQQAPPPPAHGTRKREGSAHSTGTPETHKSDGLVLLGHTLATTPGGEEEEALCRSSPSSNPGPCPWSHGGATCQSAGRRPSSPWTPLSHRH